MSGAAYHAMWFTASLTDRLFDFMSEKVIHRDRMLIQQNIRLYRQSAPFRNFVSRAREIVDRAGSNLVEAVTNVESEASLTGDHVGRSGLRIYFADGGDQPRNLVCLTSRRRLSIRPRPQGHRGEDASESCPHGWRGPEM